MAADVVGVVMGLHYVFDPHAGVMRECEVLLDVELRVDDRDADVLVTDQIRAAAQIVVDNLTEIMLASSSVAVRSVPLVGQRRAKRSCRRRSWRRRHGAERPSGPRACCDDLSSTGTRSAGRDRRSDRRPRRQPPNHPGVRQHPKAVRARGLSGGRAAGRGSGGSSLVILVLPTVVGRAPTARARAEGQHETCASRRSSPSRSWPSRRPGTKTGSPRRSCSGLAQNVGLETILGAFAAGAMLSLIDRDTAMTHPQFRLKLEAVGFGVFIPIFFVTSGVRFDLNALFSSASTVVRVPLSCLGCCWCAVAPRSPTRAFSAVPER